MREDLELDTLDTQIQDSYYDYVSKTTYRGEDFWIVFDDVEFKKSLGFESQKDFEEYLDEIFEYNWGYSDSWQECYNCGVAIYTDDYTQEDYWIDYEGSGIYCKNCVKTVPEVRNSYLEYLSNNAEACNTLLSNHELEEAGLEKLEGTYEDGYYGRNDSPSKILNDLRDKYPYGEFIFNLTGGGAFYTGYEVWAFPGYKEGAIEDAKE